MQNIYWNEHIFLLNELHSKLIAKTKDSFLIFQIKVISKNINDQGLSVEILLICLIYLAQ